MPNRNTVISTVAPLTTEYEDYENAEGYLCVFYVKVKCHRGDRYIPSRN
ncbi:MAG TPA: hypothetical protein V6C78_16235 [Crinalium sp.]|jgi:hypothetical protein